MIEEQLINTVKNEKIKGIEKIRPKTPKGIFGLHTSVVACGHTNSGKTNAVINLVKYYQDYGSFNMLFCISPTYDQNPAFEVLKIPPDHVISGEDALFKGVKGLMNILNIIKNKVEEYKENEEYQEAYKLWKNGKPLNVIQATLLHNKQYKKIPVLPRPSPCLILDDLSHSDIYAVGRKNPLINLLLRHRHYEEVGLSIFMLVQTFTTGVPKALRQNIRQYLLWHTFDQTQLDSLFEQLAQGMTREDFEYYFNYATKDNPHDFLTVDLVHEFPGDTLFRKNFNILLKPRNQIEKDSIEREIKKQKV
jgi:hypothetical protein